MLRLKLIHVARSMVLAILATVYLKHVWDTNFLGIPYISLIFSQTIYSSRNLKLLAVWNDVTTVKPVCNDHLSNKIYYLWFIQKCVLMKIEGTNLLLLTISAFWSSSPTRWALEGREVSH